MRSVNILGTKINITNKKEVLEKIEKFVDGKNQHYLVTPNPEIILKSLSNEEYFNILNMADISLPDGMGLKIAGWLMFENIRRITGSDITKDILKMAEEKGYKVGIMNKKDGLSSSKEIKDVLREKYPKLKFEVDETDVEWEMPYYRKINAFKPDVLFVLLGAPWQEKFASRLLTKMSFVKMSLGVGGSFDFLTGKAVRAPKFMRIVGMEWLWRLIKQPKRIKRIWNAVFVFSYKFIVWRLVKPLLYRKNVACMLFKKEKEKYMILLVERAGEKGHWQFPQGGTDGEDLETAGIRELTDEIGAYKFKPIKTYENLYKYKFGEKKGENNNNKEIAKHLGYKGQIQGLLIAEFYGKNDEIKVQDWEHSGWKWVDLDSLIDSVHEKRRESVEIYINKFSKLYK